jgi:fucose 4-O-acetylase-like acetyltransferase
MRLLLGTCITFVLQLRISDWFTEGNAKEETFLMKKLSDLVAPVVIFQILSAVYQNKGTKMNSSGVGLPAQVFTCASYALRSVVSWNESGGLEYVILYHKIYTHINFC